MRKEHKSESGGLTPAGRKYFKRKDGSNLKQAVSKGKNPRRISFDARFGAMAGAMKDKNGKPTRLALALRKWGFKNKESARKFANANKKA